MRVEQCKRECNNMAGCTGFVYREHARFHVRPHKLDGSSGCTFWRSTSTSTGSIRDLRRACTIGENEAAFLLDTYYEKGQS